MNGKRKLTAEQAAAIRAAWAAKPNMRTGVTMAGLAADHGVSPAAICNIIQGHTYRDEATPPRHVPTTTRPNLRRLSAEDVVMIRGLHANGTATRTLANDYGVAYSVVWKIVNGVTYGDVA